MTKYVASPRRDDLIIIDHLFLIDPESRPCTKEELENLNKQIKEYGKEKTDR